MPPSPAARAPRGRTRSFLLVAALTATLTACSAVPAKPAARADQQGYDQAYLQRDLDAIRLG